MKKIIKSVSLIFFLTSTIALFYTADRVQDLEDNLNTVQNQIADEKEARKVIMAEWQFLNAPSRLEKLAGKHLGLTLTSARQAVDLQNVPVRAKQTADSKSSSFSDLYSSRNKDITRNVVSRVSVKPSLKPRYSHEPSQRLIGVSLGDVWAANYE